jgi:hypothetical protein
MSRELIQTYDEGQVVPIVPGSGVAYNIQLGRSLTLAAGTILGMLNSAINHRWTITVANTVSGGAWDLTVTDPIGNAAVTLAGLAYNITNAALEDRLEEVFGAGNVAVAGTALATGPITITLQGDYAGIPAALPTIDGAELTGGGSYGIAETLVGQAADSYVAASTLKASPPAAAVTPSGTGSSGGWAAGAYVIQHTFETATGETTAGPQAAVALTAGQQLRIAQITGLDARITRVNIYANGSHVGSITPASGSAAQADFTTTAASRVASKTPPTINTTGNPRAILPRDLATDASGLVTLGARAGGYLNDQGDASTPALFGGVFKTTDLVGLDADAAAILGRILKGTLADGLIAVLC